MSRWPFSVAWCRGVAPSLSLAVAAAGSEARSSRTLSASPAATAENSSALTCFALLPTTRASGLASLEPQASAHGQAHSDTVPFKMCPQGTKPARWSVCRLATFFGLHRAAGTLPPS